LLSIKTWRTVLQNFLLAYRTTPHATTGVSSAELMFNRTIKDKLPQRSPIRTTGNNAQIRDRLRKNKTAAYADQRNRAAAHKINQGDAVLIADQTPHRNKFTPRWKNIRYKVTEVKGNAIFLQDGKKQGIMRTSAHVKPYKQRIQVPRRRRESRRSDTESSTCNDFDLPAQRPQGTTNADESSDAETVPYEGSDSDEGLFVPEPRNRDRRMPARFEDYVMDN
jgi:hypothetical protein